MNENILKLKPTGVWTYFKEILEVPRASKKEEKIIAYLENFAKRNGFEYKKDAIGNILIKGKATPGCENRKTVILQSHVDMVCEKNSDSKHNFDKDPIEAVIKGDWLHAKDTTLGADDGIGVATSLALLMDKTIEHGPIECLFTVDEETGLTGANNLKPDFLEGRILLNLDSEDEGEIFIGCAGGKDTVIKLYHQTIEAPKTGFDTYEITIKGLKGGHSGDDINKGLANANKLINRILWKVSSDFEMLLADIQGGNLRNAIAREAKALVLIPTAKATDFENFIKQMEKDFRNEYAVTEPNLEAKAIKSTEKVSKILSNNDQTKLLESLYACPHGVIAMSQTIPNFVETSTNLASVKKLNDHILITTSQRSSIESSKDDVANMVASCFALAGAETEHTDGYPGWTPNPNSEILSISEKCYEKLFGKKPATKAIHAGLECGLIGHTYPDMDMISYGPTLRGVHSPDERIEISTVQKFWDFTIEILKNVPEK
ncbi:MAG: aminoacyl-histidine dipeptidase [Lentimicrobiaceae bacterium]|jgi:dipeptidase D|nr:aminoacyl-histidine dipeptidase [Lentimicrobiaceae bacterium]